MDRHRKNLLTLSAYLNAAVLLSVVYVGVATLDFYRDRHPDAKKEMSSSLMERNLAIEKARQAGQDSYTYETGFTPGLGMTSGTTE